MSNVVDLNAEREAREPANPRGTVEVYPTDEMDGGAWAVDHISRNRDSGARIGVRLALHDAVKLARKTAAETGADFFEGVAI